MSLDYWRSEPDGLYLSWDQGGYYFHDVDHNFEYRVDEDALQALWCILDGPL